MNSICRRAIPSMSMTFLVWVAVSANCESTDASEWSASDETALRKLITTSDVILVTYLNEAGIPLKRLAVPDAFVDSYRKDSKASLTVLLDIVEHGTPHDAIVAFHFANAGDEPQIALPLLHYLNANMLEKPFGKTQTYRQFCIELVKKRVAELESTEVRD